MTSRVPWHHWPQLTLRSKMSIAIGLFVFFSNLLLLLLDAWVLDPTPDGLLLHFNLHFWVIFLMGLALALFGYNLAWQFLKPLSTLNTQLLDLHYSQLKSADFIETGNEYQEIKVLRASLKSLLNQIEKDQKQREIFISTLVHDLRTPLLAQGYLLEMIARNDHLGQDERVRLVKQLKLENSRITDLLQKIVDTYKLEYQDLSLEKQPTELSEIVLTVLKRLEHVIEQGHLKVMFQPSSASFMVDAREVERALHNLVTNAVRYAKTQITLEVGPLGVSVEDDGPGLAAPLEELAQPFNAQPVNIAGERYSAGIGGLGLYIAKTIAEAHGGGLVQLSSHRGLKLLLRLVP